MIDVRIVSPSSKRPPRSPTTSTSRYMFLGPYATAEINAVTGTPNSLRMALTMLVGNAAATLGSTGHVDNGAHFLVMEHLYRLLIEIVGDTYSLSFRFIPLSLPNPTVRFTLQQRITGIFEHAPEPSHTLHTCYLNEKGHTSYQI